jgi:hypothetical protein
VTSRTCKKTGQRSGSRRAPGRWDAALVRMEVGAPTISGHALRNGNWVMKPTRLIQVTPNPSWRQTLAASAAMKPPPMISMGRVCCPSLVVDTTKGGPGSGSGSAVGVSQGQSRQRDRAGILRVAMTDA